jgi:hypothetical protein
MDEESKAVAYGECAQHAWLETTGALEWLEELANGRRARRRSAVGAPTQRCCPAPDCGGRDGTPLHGEKQVVASRVDDLNDLARLQVSAPMAAQAGSRGHVRQCAAPSAEKRRETMGEETVMS